MKVKKDKPTQTNNNVKQLILSKKSPNNNKTISHEKQEQLEELFIMDGITPYQAAKVVGIHQKTANRYFEQWAEELIQEPDHESWAYRQKRVRVRALEGITKKIIYVNSQRDNLQQVQHRLMFVKEGDEFVLKPEEYLKDNLVLAYNRGIMELTSQLMELQDEYDAIDSQPPASVILKHEIIELANEVHRVAE